MTKRFSYIKNNSITQYQSLPIQEIGKSKSLHCQGVVDKLNKLFDENEQLKQEKPFLKIHNDYFIQYGDDRELFSMHKPSDIRSLMYLINRENGYSELQCEYNDLELKEDD